MIISTLSAAAAAFFLLPIVSDILSMLQVALGRGRQTLRTVGGGSRFLYLIPAHNEGSHIEAAIRSVRRQLYPADRISILVVADNCVDNTVSRARLFNVECIERWEPSRPGKPEALVWAFRRLNVTAFDAVVILDADSIVDPRHAAALDRRGNLRKKVLAGYNDVRNRYDSALTRLASVFAAARYRSAYRLKELAGLNVPLSDGLCIGTDILRTFPWRATSDAEDCETYARLTALGVPIELAVDAHTYSTEKRTLRQAMSQRGRWLAGRVDIVRRMGGTVLRSRAIGWHQKLDALQELVVPGPAFHAGIVGALVSALLLMNAPSADALSAALLLTLIRPAAYALIGVRLDPEPRRALVAFCFLPVYSIWRCAVALRSAVQLVSGGNVRAAR